MNNISKISLLLCYLFMCYTAFLFYPKWEKTGTEATLSWDVSGYYMYLPAIFIYKDLKQCRFKDDILNKYHPTSDFQQAFLDSKSGNYVMKYASGQALLMSPFFFVAHVWATYSSKFPPDGFSFPYQFCIGLGCFLYALIGLYFLRKILLFYFKDVTVAIVLVSFVFGSNYLNYSSIDQAMTHNSLFCVSAILIFYSVKFYKNPTKIRAISIGLLVGLAVLIRLPDIILGLIPIFWGVSNLQELRLRYQFFVTHFSKYILAGIFFSLIFSIQFIYWKFVTGHWFVYSYQEQGFSWLHPNWVIFSTSYKCGWLRFCPMMALPYLGLLPFLLRKQNLFAVISLIFINYYIVTAWDIWDYGGTSGRAMVQSYPILAFPFAALIEEINKKKILQALFYSLFFFFIYLNIWWTYHAHKGNVPVFDLSKEYYWRVLGKWQTNDSDKKLLDTKFSYRGSPAQFISFYKNNFEQDSSKNALTFDSDTKIQLNETLQNTADYWVERPNIVQKWVRISADFYAKNKEWDVWKQSQFIVKFYFQEKEIQDNMIRVQRFFDNSEEKNIFLDAIPPKSWDKMKVYFWNAGSDKQLIINNLEIITFDK